MLAMCDVMPSLHVRRTQDDYGTARQRMLQDGTTDLHRVSWMGDVPLVQQYLEAKGAVDAPDEKGSTALFLAAGYGQDVVVCVLTKNMMAC